MELYFLRHGQAGQRSAWVGDDALRPLTEAGRERMVQEATTMRKLGLAPDVIVTSPLARARQTAEVVAEILGLEARLVEDDRLAPGFSLDDLGGILSHLKGGSSGESVLLVGHEPDLSEIVGRLVGGADVLFKKGALARVDLPARTSISGGSSRGLEGRGQLVWLLQPAVLAP